MNSPATEPRDSHDFPFLTGEAIIIVGGSSCSRHISFITYHEGIPINSKPWLTSLIIVLLLTAVTLAVYLQTLSHDFLNYDDDKYITKNPNLLHGREPVGTPALPAIRWGLTSFYAANWHPLTWASHILDLELWGRKPMGHHLTNLLLHLANVLLLFLVLSRMTGALWKSGFVAALFAVHPLHMESVAWIAERKDVLSTLFWMLTMLAYVRYVEFKVQGSRFKVGAYALVVVFFALGLMAKPMLVTLPVVLLLLDYWPLCRFRGGPHPNPLPLRGCTGERVTHRGSRITPVTRYPLLVTEKLPLFALSIASSIITWLAQEKGRSLGTLEMLSPGVRISNALVSYAAYLGKTVWPQKLAVFCPHPREGIPAWQVFTAIIVLAGISYLVYRHAGRRPYLAVGWLWYIGTLIPVIGLVQVGGQAMADRYSYIPLVGLFIVLGWGIPDLVKGRKEERKKGRSSIPPFLHSSFLPITASIVLLALTVCAYVQVGYWKNSFTLFRRSLSVVESDVAHNNLGLALEGRGKRQEAIRHYSAALAILPTSVEAQGNLANALSSTGRIEDAIAGYEAILEFRPDDHKAHNNLANALMKQGKIDEAIRHYYDAIELNPSDPIVHYNLSTALFAKKDYQGARKEVSLARDYGFQGDPGFVKRVEQAAQ